jgi:DNA-binding GntR family transcriptional regulator
MTRGAQVHKILRADILAGRRHPGSRLPFAELTLAYDASIGVLREALARLAAEGLVTTEPQHGYRVMALSLEDLDELTVARCEIEGLVLRQAIKHGDLEWESRVVAAQHRLERIPDRTSDEPSALSDAWSTAHTDFHRALIEGCPNGRMLTMIENLWDAIEIYIRWSAPVKPPERDIATEHRALAEATIARDADAAVDVLVTHVQLTQQVLLDGLAQLIGSADGTEETVTVTEAASASQRSSKLP